MYAFCLISHSNLVQPTKLDQNIQTSSTTWLLPQNPCSVTDFDSIRCFDFSGQNTDNIVAFIVASEGTNVNLYGVPMKVPDSVSCVRLTPLKTMTPELSESTIDIVRTNVTREAGGSTLLQICASDRVGNIHIWENFEQTDVIFSAHTKRITDMLFLRLSLTTPPLLASCSLDGSLKIWDCASSVFTPVYEHFSSKKWVYSLFFEPTLPALFLNQEGKNCPQKILYFRNHYMNQEFQSLCDRGSDQDERGGSGQVMTSDYDKVLLRQYKLLNETVLQTNSYLSNDLLYNSGTNGIIYRMTKRDMARLVHRHKEKLKGNLARRVLQIRRKTSSDSGKPV